MVSLQRLVVSPARSFASVGTWWRGSFWVLALAAAIVLRACGYQVGVVAGYAFYVAAYVVLPGSIAVAFVNRGPLSLAMTVALAVPTGFALEIFTFLGLAALEAKAVYQWTPLAWLALAVTIRIRSGRWPVRCELSGHHAAIGFGLAVAFLGTAVMAVSQMFAESPLAQGLPTRAIFHDWVYLVSRAAVIKNNWPLDDPSLSGTPLQYHYFMMVHAAAVSWTTGVEISTVMLRLLYVPLGAVLVAQAYMLGRMVARTPWGGVIAAWLVVAASEMSFASTYGEPMFLGLFVRWLFVSPTFFFGMIFCGALLLAIARCGRLARCDARHYVWILLLGTAGTGAKGTVLPVLLCALGLWTVWRWWHERRLPVRPVLFGVILATAFLIVYIPTMSSWRTGDAAWRPFHVFQLTQFWKQQLPTWQAAMATWLPVPVAAVTATLMCALVVFAGTCGVRLLAVPYLFWGDLERRDCALVSWIGAFFVASAGMGLMMELNSYGELYLILMMRVPMAVLTAGFVIAAARRIGEWRRQAKMETTTARRSLFATGVMTLLGNPGSRGWSRAWVLGATTVLASALFVQTSLWWTRNRVGLKEWIKTPADMKPDGYMQELREALLWVRGNTEPDAVLVPNAFTPENMKKDHWGALDRTLMGVHFYYSALSERRVWFEGPNYIMDTTRARIRANMASNYFYRGRALPPNVVSDGPSYVLIDRSLADGAKPAPATAQKVFENARMQVYRLSEAVGDGS